ncbi:MAG: flippase-like domain-containing protein [Candidatus Aenigmarchaeota archaeon]|nr:flippase-like domain-containing protein [Candidatus Aenigmarchaeota archaeon]
MKKTIITSLLGVALFVLVLYLFGIEKIFSLLLKTNISFFIFASISYLVAEILAALKLRFISNLKFKEIFFSHVGGMFLGQLTPGKAGYFYTSYSLAKKESVSISGKVGQVSLVMALMMLSKIFLITASLIYFSFLFSIPNYFLLSFLMPVLIVSLVFIVLYSKSSKRAFLRIPLLRKGVKYIELMQKAVREVSFKNAVLMILLDVIGWTFWGMTYYFLIHSIGLNLPYLTCLFLQPLLSAILFIPISPNALGLGESGGALIFSLLGLSPGDGVAFLILSRIVTLFVDSVGILDLRTVKIPKKYKIFNS